MTDSSSDVTLTLKRKPSSVSFTNSEDSPVVGNLKPNKQDKKKQCFVSEEFMDGEENEQNMESCIPAVTTLDVLSKKLDSLVTKDYINQFKAEIPFPISHFKYKVACVCCNAITGSGPVYLSELLHVYTPSHPLCSSSDTHTLKIQQYKCKSHGFRAFSCFGPHIWNSLLHDLRHCSTLSSFKAKLKFSQYFHTN